MKKKERDRSRYPYVYEIRGEHLEPHTIWMLRPFDVHAKTFKCPRCGKCVFRARNQNGKRIMISAEKDHYREYWYPIYHYYDCKGLK